MHDLSKYLIFIAPVDHCDDLPIPVPPEKENSTHSYTSDEMTSDKDFYSGFESRKHVITQQDLDYLVRDLELLKGRAELLGSRLQDWNLLDAHCSVTKYRNRHEQFSLYYSV